GRDRWQAASGADLLLAAPRRRRGDRRRHRAARPDRRMPLPEVLGGAADHSLTLDTGAASRGAGCPLRWSYTDPRAPHGTVATIRPWHAIRSSTFGVRGARNPGGVKGRGAR